ncbi:MAG TPA: hypothetical protein VF188_06820 [Longimicrobiales bacterium]
MSDKRKPTGQGDRDGSDARRPWMPPQLEALPPLSELTLQTGNAIPGHGEPGGGGGTVF